MSRVVIVMPSIHVPTTVDCLASFSPETIDRESLSAPPTQPQRDPVVQTVNGREWSDGGPRVRLMVIWNTPTANLGVSQSWEAGRREVLSTEADWLWVLSAAMVFGPAGGTDFLKRLDEFADVRPDVPVIEAGGGAGWHCIAFSRWVLEEVGPFDPIFPSYCEDLDWSVRFQRAYDRDTHAPGFSGPLWPKVEIDATLTEVAHGIKRGGVQVDLQGMRDRLARKWGANEEYATPYNDDTLDWTHVGPRP